MTRVSLCQVAEYSYDIYGNLTSHSFNGYSFTYNTLGSILTAKTGEQLIAVYTYSANTQQNVLNAEFGNGQAVAYEYDGDNRLLNVRQGTDGKYGYSYAKDDKGELTATTITDAVNSLVKVIEDDKTTVKTADDVLLYSVETHFRDDKAENSFDGRTVTVGGTSYTLVQNEKSDEFKAGETVDFSKNYAYNEDGELESVSLGGVTTEFEYTTDKNVNSLKMLLNSSNSKTYSYTYDDDGNIKTETVTTVSKGENGETVENTDTTEYTYDSKNQLVSAENGTARFEYVYDGRGNILSNTEYAVTTDENGEKVYTAVDSDSYAYDETWKDKLSSFNGQSITYDEIGNPTEYLGQNLTWTMGRQLASFGSNTYRYDENGIRTSKTVGGVTTDYYLDGTDIIYQTDGTTSLHFHYDRNDELIGFKYNGNDYFYVKNIQGDITAITDSVGNVIAEYSYDPWGKVLSVDGNAEIGNINPFRYRSYYYDAEIGMYYLQSRYYNPEVGRFINSDDVNYIGTSASEFSYNPFIYCENEPVNCSDPSGKSSTTNKTVIAIVLLIQALALIQGFMSYLIPNQECKYSYLKIDYNGLFSAKVKYQIKKWNWNELKIFFGDYYAWKNSTSAYNNNSKIYYDYYTDCVLSEVNDPQYNFWYLFFMTDIVLFGTIIHYSINAATAKKVFNPIWGNKGVDPKNKNSLFTFYVTQEKKYNGIYYYNPKKDYIKKVK